MRESLEKSIPVMFRGLKYAEKICKTFITMTLKNILPNRKIRKTNTAYGVREIFFENQAISPPFSLSLKVSSSTNFDIIKKSPRPLIE